MKFADVIGQEQVKQRLINCAANSRVPHALLLSGRPGAGKFALALAFAQYLLCDNPTEHDSCGECSFCRQISNFEHPDLHFVFPYIKTESKKLCDDYLPQWKQMLHESPYFDMDTWLAAMSAEKKQALIYSDESAQIARKLSRKSFSGKTAVMIIWLPERMHEVCSNKLLKLLEEPPEDTLFLLVSEEPEKLLPTIISRTQIINVPPIAIEDLQTCFSSEAARLAQGSYTAARAIEQDSASLQEEMQMYRSIMLMAYQRDLSGFKLFAENMAAKGREYAATFLRYCQRLTRETFVANFNNSSLNYMGAAEAQFVSKFRKFVGTDNIERIMEIFEDAASDIERNVNEKIVVFDMGLQLMTQIKN